MGTFINLHYPTLGGGLLARILQSMPTLRGSRSATVGLRARLAREGGRVRGLYSMFEGGDMSKTDSISLCFCNCGRVTRSVCILYPTSEILMRLHVNILNKYIGGDGDDVLMKNNYACNERELRLVNIYYFPLS